jgi:hypothetical protein
MLLIDCELCRQLGDVDRSFSKHGWPDATALEPAANRLEFVAGVPGRDSQNHHIRRCSRCGTYYQYDWSYEYLVNGSEDSEELRRLTPTQAQRFLSDEEYAARQAEQAAAIGHADEATRRFAARSVFEECVARADWAAAGEMLGQADPVIVGAALSQLDYLLESVNDGRAAYAPLKPTLAGLADQPGRFDAWAAALLRSLPPD